MDIMLSYFLQGNESEMAIRHAKFCNLRHYTSSYSKTQCQDTIIYKFMHLYYPVISLLQTVCNKYVLCWGPLHRGNGLTCHESRYTKDWSVEQCWDTLHCLCVHSTAAVSSVWCQAHSATRWWWLHHYDQLPKSGHLVTRSDETLHTALRTLWQVSSPPPSTLGYACGYLTVGQRDSLQHVRSVILKGYKRLNVLKTVTRRTLFKRLRLTVVRYTWMWGKQEL